MEWTHCLKIMCNPRFSWVDMNSVYLKEEGRSQVFFPDRSNRASRLMSDDASLSFTVEGTPVPAADADVTIATPTASFSRICKT